MQYVALSADRYGKRISGASGKYADHGISGGGYKTRRRKKGMNILNNPKCLYLPLGDECGNTSKGKSGGVGGGRRQR